MSTRLALVTGGSSGIGKCLVESLARNGYAVAFSYRSSPAPANVAVARLRAEGLQVMACAGDVGISADVSRFVASACDWQGVAPCVFRPSRATVPVQGGRCSGACRAGVKR